MVYFSCPTTSITGLEKEFMGVKTKRVRTGKKNMSFQRMVGNIKINYLSRIYKSLKRSARIVKKKTPLTNFLLVRNN